MSRALKLFCLIGPLFILIALISFLWPAFLIEKDLHTVEMLFTQETRQEQLDLAQNRGELFKIKMNQSLSLIKSSLLYVQESPAIQASFEGSINKGDIWKKAGKTLAYNSGLGLLQILEDHKPLIAIAPENALLYPSKIISLNDHVVYVLVDDYRGLLEPFIGIKPLVGKVGDPVDSYFLYPISYIFPNATTKDPDLLKNLRSFAASMSATITKENINSLKTLIPYLAEHYNQKRVRVSEDGKGPAPKELLSFYNHSNSFFMNMLVRDFIRILLDGIEKSPFENGAPYGITSFSIEKDSVFNGVSMLSSDLFFDESLTAATVSNDSYLIIDNPLLKEVFIGSSLDLKTSNGLYTITLASSLTPILSDLITNEEAIAIISDNGEPYIAVNPAGIQLPHTSVQQISLKAIKEDNYGLVEFNNVRYQFMQLRPFDQSKITIVILRPETKDPLYSLHKTIISELNKTSKDLSEQLFAINFGILLLALIMLLILSRAVTRPICKLTAATEQISKGNFADIEMPPFKKGSKDEVAILSERFESMVVSLRDKEKMRAVLDKVVSKEIAAEILKGNVHLGGENRDVTVMFADIRNFTGMSEKLEPQRLITFLNKFMTKMSVIIEEHYGVIDKYVGDEIMALYGAPHTDPDSARKAVITAIKMVEALKVWNQERAAEGFPEIAIGIGINTGKMVAGNMGAENRLNYTVLGANVNLGARLCSKAAPMQILVSEATLEASGLKDSLNYTEIESLPLKGFTEPVKAFSILGFKS